MKKLILSLVVLCMAFALFANGAQEAPAKELSAVQQIVKQAESMTLEELAKNDLSQKNETLHLQ